MADAEAAARVKLAEQARATRHAERERKTAEIRAAIGGVTCEWLDHALAWLVYYLAQCIQCSLL